MTARRLLAGALLAGALLALAPAGATAQPIDLSSGGPVQVNAAGGIDWQQNQQLVIAHGDARATRGNVTVTAAELIAHYRKKAAPPGAPAAPAAPSADGQPDDTGGSEVYRLDALNDVHIFTPTDQAFGDHAAYDMDQSVLVLTGHHLKLITPQDVLTATDSMEYYPKVHISIARGHAVVVTNDARRIAADVLVGYSTPGQGNPTPPPSPAPPVIQAAAKPPADPLLASGKLQKVEAFGHVDVRTPTETVLGDRGVYVPDTGKAHIIGHVRITRGQNQLNGSEAEVNMKTGVATMLPGGADRVHGLIVPNDAQAQTAPAAKPTATKPTAAKPATKPAAKAATPARASGA
jgi:lipopolysaccharide export system protein LptA